MVTNTRNLILHTLISTALAAFALSGCDFFMSDQARIEKARELQARGEYRTAVIELKKVLQSKPDNRDARFVLGQVSLGTGDVTSAEKELRRAYELGLPMDKVALPLGQALLAQRKYDEVLKQIDLGKVTTDEAKAVVLFVRGDAYLGLRKLDDAQHTFREILRLQNNSLDARIGLAKVEQGRGNFKGAEDYISQVLSADSAYAEGWLAKGQLEFVQRKYADAEAAFNRALEGGKSRRLTAPQEFVARNELVEAQWRQGKSKEALDNVNRLLKLSPRDPRARYLRALIAYGSGDYETATQDLQQVLRVSPDYKPAQLLLGATHYARGDLEQADMYLSSVLAGEPSSLQARKLLAATRLREQKPRDALAALTPAVAQGTTDSQALALMGRASLEAGDEDKGILYLERGAQADPENQTLQMELASGYLSAGELERAIEILEKLPPTQEGAYRRELLLILAYLRKHDTDGALAQASNLLKTRPKDPGVLNLTGSIYMVSGQFTEARKYFDQALQLEPENIAVQMNLARLEYHEGKQDDARARFEHVLQLSSKNVNAMIALAQLSAQRGDHDQARQWLERASTADPQAVAPKLLLVRYYLATRALDHATGTAQELARAHPDNGEVQNALGAVQMAQGKYQDATASFDKAVKLAPKSANFHYNLARAQLALRNFGQAKQILTKTLELDANHVPATATLAVIEMREGNSAQALNRARKLQQQDKNSPVGFMLEGDLYMMQRKFGDAVRAYDMAAGLGESAALVIRSYEARKWANIPDPAKPLKKWLQDNPKDIHVGFVLAQAYVAENDTKAAIRQYEAILKLIPDNANVLNNLAWLYHVQNDPRALKLAERAHQISPERGGITDTLGWLLVQKGELERGLQLLREAARQVPNVPDVRYHLAVALAKSGAKEEARKTLTELISSGKSFKDIEEAKKLLQQL